jgi:hypothetical protein
VSVISPEYFPGETKLPQQKCENMLERKQAAVNSQHRVTGDLRNIPFDEIEEESHDLVSGEFQSYQKTVPQSKKGFSRLNPLPPSSNFD